MFCTTSDVSEFRLFFLVLHFAAAVCPYLPALCSSAPLGPFSLLQLWQPRPRRGPARVEADPIPHRSGNGRDWAAPKTGKRLHRQGWAVGLKGGSIQKAPG